MTDKLPIPSPPKDQKDQPTLLASTPTYAVDGGIADTDATQGTGALCTGIGVSPQVSTQPAQQSNTVADFVAVRIGGVTSPVVALGAAYGAGKGMRYLTTVGAVAIGAVVSGTYLNRSTRAMVAGDSVWAVAP